MPSPRTPFTPPTGRCACNHIHYRILSPFLTINACHCRYCQRETGSAFATNGLIEPDRVELLPSVTSSSISETTSSGKDVDIVSLPSAQEEPATAAAAEVREPSLTINHPILVPTPSESGNPQLIARCPRCFVALWSTYPAYSPTVCAIRVGTLDEPDRWPVRFHIFGESMVPWVRKALEAEARNRGDGDDGGSEARIFETYYDWEALWERESVDRRRDMVRRETEGKSKKVVGVGSGCG